MLIAVNIGGWVQELCSYKYEQNEADLCFDIKLCFLIVSMFDLPASNISFTEINILMLLPQLYSVADFKFYNLLLDLFWLVNLTLKPCNNMFWVCMDFYMQ